MFDFHVVPGSAVVDILRHSRTEVLDLVQHTYLLHDAGESVNPDSYFLRFPEKPDCRGIALPAYLGGDVDCVGLKWITSFPGNVRAGKPRASAVLVLNDYATGYPIACIEGAAISAARTAASATLAATTLSAPERLRHIAFVGAGVIARTILDYLLAAGVEVSSLSVHDRDEASADHLLVHASRMGVVRGRLVELAEVADADLVVFATTAPRPYVPADLELRPGQVVLNVSLRDLPPELLLRTNNVLDDVDHCLKAETSPHLAERLTGGRDFIDGTLAQVINGEVKVDPEKPTVFSPFGLGVLDVAVGRFVLDEAKSSGRTIPVDDFFGERHRW